MKPSADQPVWVCVACGDKWGLKECGIATWHIDQCDVCGQHRAVTEPRDFGYLKTGWANVKKESVPAKADSNAAQH